MIERAELMPFTATPNNSLPWRGLSNFLAAFPVATYERPTFRRRYPWPIGDIFYICDPVLLEDMLVKRADAFVRDDATTRAFAAQLDRGSLFLAEGTEWRWRRRALSSAFRHEALLGFIPTFSLHAKRRVGGVTPGMIDVAALMTDVAFDVMLDAILGEPGHVARAELFAALDAAYDGMPWWRIYAKMRLPASTPFPGSRRARRAANQVYDNIARIVAERRAQPVKRMDLVNLLLSAADPETARQLDDAHVAGDILAFIVAGYETSATALGWTLWLLARDGDMQERARREIDEIVGAGEVTSDAVERLVFLRQCVEEALRLFPPVPAIGRQPRETMDFAGERITPQTQIIAPTWSLHRNPLVWDNPLRFDPDRFSPERAKARSRCAYLPFGAGPRICLGMSFAMLEIVTVLAIVLRRLRFDPMPGNHLTLQTKVTLRSRGGLPLIASVVRDA